MPNPQQLSAPGKKSHFPCYAPWLPTTSSICSRYLLWFPPSRYQTVTLVVSRSIRWKVSNVPTWRATSKHLQEESKKSIQWRHSMLQCGRNRAAGTGWEITISRTFLCNYITLPQYWYRLRNFIKTVGPSCPYIPTKHPDEPALPTRTTSVSDDGTEDDDDDDDDTNRDEATSAFVFGPSSVVQSDVCRVNMFCAVCRGSKTRREHNDH